MSEERLTVAELLARAEKTGEGQARSDRPRRRRRSLDEGGISVAELTGSIPKVKAEGPRRGAHAAPDDYDEDEVLAQEAAAEEREAEERAAEERAQAEAAEREAAEREAAEREAAEREAAEQERAEREAAERRAEEEHRAEQERVEREAAERRAEQERAEREAAEQERAEREAAERRAEEEHRAEQERAEQERVEREAAEREAAEREAESREDTRPRAPMAVPAAVPLDPRPVLTNDDRGEVTFTFTKLHDADTGSIPVAEVGPVARELLDGSSAYDDRPTTVLPTIGDPEIVDEDADRADDRDRGYADAEPAPGYDPYADSRDDDYPDDHRGERVGGYPRGHEEGYDEDYAAPYADDVEEVDEYARAARAERDDDRDGRVALLDDADERDSRDDRDEREARDDRDEREARRDAADRKKLRRTKDGTLEDDSLSWGLLIVQVIVGLILGALAFLAFNFLWASLPTVVCAVIAVVFTVLLVVGVNLVRREKDGITPILAGLVGLMVSFGPWLMTLF